MANIKKLTSIEEYNEFINSDSEKTLIVKLGADYCGPCRTLEGMIAGLTDEEVDGVMLGEVNVDDEWFEEKATELRVRGIPVLIAYKDGQEVNRLVGGTTKAGLLEFFEGSK